VNRPLGREILQSFTLIGTLVAYLGLALLLARAIG
jgi:hypothetical protein